MATYVYWFLAGLVLLGLEMVTGTFYLLMLGVALAIGGCAALLGLEPTLQFILAGIAGIVGTVILRKNKSIHPAAQTEQSLDIGLAVKVLTWHDNGSARVYFRGAEWDAELDANTESPDTPHQDTLYIKALRGSTLILTQHKP